MFGGVTNPHIELQTDPMKKSASHHGSSDPIQMALIYGALVLCVLSLVFESIEFWHSPAKWRTSTSLTSIGLMVLIMSTVVRGRRVVLANILVGASLVLTAAWLFLRLRYE
jgi:hypothetical protein